MYVYIGKITNTHGLKGELKLKSDFIYLDKVLKDGFNFYIEKKDKVVLNSFRYHNDVILIAFNDLLDINLVETLKNKNLYVLKEDLNLKENQFVFEDYIGLNAIYKEKELGKVTDIIDCGLNNYVFEIDKKILIPINDNFIDKVILNDKIIFKDVEGLIDAN